MNLKRSLAASIMFLAAAGTAAAACPAQLGRPGDEQRVSRQIILQPGTRWANVTEGEVIRFVVHSANGAQGSFTWDFDTFGGRNFDLGCVAPKGLLQRTVKVYLDTDPRYEGQ